MNKSLITLCVAVLLLPTVIMSQSPGAGIDAFVNWAKGNAIRLKSFEMSEDFSDLRPLRSTIDNARIVALADPLHGTHEALKLRNRLFRYFVEEMGFTAIALETGVTEAMQAEAYVIGMEVDKKVAAQTLFSNNRAIAYQENLELIEWMRHYNSDLPPSRRIHVYGLDMSGQVAGDFTQSRIALDGALAYLNKVDVDQAGQFQKKLDPFLPQFQETFGTPKAPDYRSLAESDRNTLTATISELVSVFERHRIEFIAASTEHEYLDGYRNAIAARQLDNHFRVRPEGRGAPPLDFAEPATARDNAMAENALWALQQAAPSGRVFIFAAGGHVNRGDQLGDPRFFPNKPPRWMGQYLASALGNDYFVFGTAFKDSDPKLNAGTIDPSSFPAALARVSIPLFGINLRQALATGAAADWIKPTRSGFDGFFFIESITPAQILQ